MLKKGNKAVLAPHVAPVVFLLQTQYVINVNTTNGTYTWSFMIQILYNFKNRGYCDPTEAIVDVFITNWYTVIRWFSMLMVFYATFNNISAISLYTNIQKQRFDLI